MIEDAVEKYIRYWETLSPRTVGLIEGLAAPGMRFKDPFNDVQGTKAVRAVLDRIFSDADNPRFRVSDHAVGRDGLTAYLRWEFTFTPRNARRIWRITGMSEVLFTPEGLVAAHTDHWDTGSQILAKLPVIGWMWGKLRRKIGGG